MTACGRKTLEQDILAYLLELDTVDVPTHRSPAKIFGYRARLFNADRRYTPLNFAVIILVLSGHEMNRLPITADLFPSKQRMCMIDKIYKLVKI